MIKKGFVSYISIYYPIYYLSLLIDGDKIYLCMRVRTRQSFS
jgi:hypothetical protein